MESGFGEKYRLIGQREQCFNPQFPCIFRQLLHDRHPDPSAGKIRCDRHCPDFLVKQEAPEPAYRTEMAFSPYTHHWHYNPEHKPVFLVSLHEQLPGGRLCGISLFSNSFGQPSAYVYAGQQFEAWLGVPALSLKVTAGILYGYVGQYQDKVPFNHKGFSPAIIPAVSYNLTPRDALQVDVLGKAAVMFAYARKF